MSRANEAPALRPLSDPILDERAAAALHDLNNPLSFLLANHMIEQEHSDAMVALLAALTALHDPRVDRLLEEFSLGSRLVELEEILTDNLTGLERLRLIAKQLRTVMTDLTGEAQQQAR